MAICCPKNQIRLWDQRRAIKRNCWDKMDVWTASTFLMELTTIQLHPLRMLGKCEHVLTLSILFLFHSECERKRTHNIIKCVMFIVSLLGLFILLCTLQKFVLDGWTVLIVWCFRDGPKKILCVLQSFPRLKVWLNLEKQPWSYFIGVFSCFNRTIRRKAKIEFMASNFINTWTEISLVSSYFLSRVSYFISYF